MVNPLVKPFWDKATGSWQYVFRDPGTMKGAIVDPVLGYDLIAGAIDTMQAKDIVVSNSHFSLDVIESESYKDIKNSLCGFDRWLSIC